MRIMQGCSFILPICRACFKKKYVFGKHILCSKGQKGTMRQKKGFSVGVLYTIIKVKAAAGDACRVAAEIYSAPFGVELCERRGIVLCRLPK